MSLPTLAAWICLALTGAGVTAPVPSPGVTDGGSIGIRLLEAPVIEQDNPRAYQYIVDHVAPGTTIRRRFEIDNLSARTQSVDISAGSATVQNGEFAWADDA